MRASTKKENHASVTKKDLLLMIHLFFLPYEHGEMAKHLVSEFKWIQGNAPPVETEKINSKSVSLFCSSHCHGAFHCIIFLYTNKS